MKTICFILDSHWQFLGGTNIYVKNFLKYLKKSKKKFKILVLYPGKENKHFKENDIELIEIKTGKIFPFNIIKYAKKVTKILKTIKNVDYINSQAMAGYYLKYFKPSCYVTNTYHGVAYYFYKCHLSRKNFIEKLGALFYMVLGYFLEKPPTKKADAIISVSEHVKKEINNLYKTKKRNIVIRSSVDIFKFKPRNKKKILKKLKLDNNKIYGLYVGRGGFWRKGLDRTIKISKEILKLNPNFMLIVVGPEKNSKNLKLIKELGKNVLYFPVLKRDELADYYAISDIFFCFSRYEGGAPILTLAEAMASGVIPICSEDSNQEIIKNKRNGLIIKNFRKKEAKEILRLLKDKKIKTKIIKNNFKKIKEFSIENWGKKYLRAITNEKEK